VLLASVISLQMLDASHAFVDRRTMARRYPPERDVRIRQPFEPFPATSHHLRMRASIHELAKRVQVLPDRQVDDDAIVVEGRRAVASPCSADPCDSSLLRHLPKACTSNSAVAAPEKFCCPVMRLPSRIVKGRHSPACTKFAPIRFNSSSIRQGN